MVLFLLPYFQEASKNRDLLDESVGAKRLFAKVNRMLAKVDSVVESLTEKEKELEEHLKVGRSFLLPVCWNFYFVRSVLG